MNAADLAKKICDKLDEDLRSRQVVGDEGALIDGDIMNGEIRPEWERLIAEEIKKQRNNWLLSVDNFTISVTLSMQTTRLCG